MLFPRLVGGGSIAARSALRNFPSAVPVPGAFGGCLCSIRSVKTTQQKASNPAEDSAPAYKIPYGEPKALPDELTEEQKRNWISYGFDYEDKREDRAIFHTAMFCYVTIMIWLGFYVAYYPDHKQKNWALREAHFEIHRRNKLGLPFVDPDYVPKERMLEQLPTEAELGDQEIVL
ncbi:unnamed protein product [Cyprideis torosa]|uniref:NADH dehydrogenase [ubiquinone] 1 beta subcomplex subunit 11, mitochondrial n=1 Tax=Cyprideis torosa TaxID=163714 RepID=A0A7R8W861_9CRUS|nr:unnamed protein product [Cyprideis torosa]CAG0883113.1 unnamed protein product [Cyprideis torosa]